MSMEPFKKRKGFQYRTLSEIQCKDNVQVILRQAVTMETTTWYVKKVPFNYKQVVPYVGEGAYIVCIANNQRHLKEPVKKFTNEKDATAEFTKAVLRHQYGESPE